MDGSSGKIGGVASLPALHDQCLPLGLSFLFVLFSCLLLVFFSFFGECAAAALDALTIEISDAGEHHGCASSVVVRLPTCLRPASSGHKR